MDLLEIFFTITGKSSVDSTVSHSSKECCLRLILFIQHLQIVLFAFGVCPFSLVLFVKQTYLVIVDHSVDLGDFLFD